MKTEEIQQIRSLLAAQPAVEVTRAPGLHHGLKSLLALKRSPSSTPPLVLAEPSAPAPILTDAPDIAPGSSPSPGDPVPQDLLLAGLAPRRPAFGRRVETVLELDAPAPAPPERLTLLAADGASVGEIVLHGRNITPANDAAARRLSEPLHSEVPFFPDDLADEPRPGLARKPATAKAPIRPGAPVRPGAPSSPPAPELAAAFLLATLAARLASEEAGLRRRLEMAQSRLRVA